MFYFSFLWGQQGEEGRVWRGGRQSGGWRGRRGGVWGRGTPAWTGETPHWAPHSSSGGCNKRLLYVTARDHAATQMSSVFIILDCKSYWKFILYFLLIQWKMPEFNCTDLGFFKTKYRTWSLQNICSIIKILTLETVLLRWSGVRTAATLLWV